MLEEAIHFKFDLAEACDDSPEWRHVIRKDPGEITPAVLEPFFAGKRPGRITVNFAEKWQGSVDAVLCAVADAARGIPVDVVSVWTEVTELDKLFDILALRTPRLTSAIFYLHSTVSKEVPPSAWEKLPCLRQVVITASRSEDHIMMDLRVIHRPEGLANISM